MNIVLTQFAVDRHFDPDKAGTTIGDRSSDDFAREARQFATQPIALRDGYAPFCKLLFLENWTNALAGTLPITPENEAFLKSEYKARKDDELPVLVRWLELPYDQILVAKYLCLVLYNKEQLAKEGAIEARRLPVPCTTADIGDPDYGIVAILGQLSKQEEPMTPMTAMRNALGIEEGGSGVPIDRDAYARSVEFWSAHATVKVTS